VHGQGDLVRWEPSPEGQDFAANVIHDLKTPLSIVLGLAGKLLDSPGLLPSTRRDVERVHANALTVLGQVEDLLHVTQLQNGGLALRPRPIDVSALLRNLVDSFRDVAAAREIVLLAQAPRSVLAIIDDEKLVTILSNLLANALKFTPVGGKVRASLEVRGARLVFSVGDSGAGVADTVRERIFERFRRGEAETRPLAEGSGLGLAIVRELVELHGGTVHVGTAREGGAEFVVELGFERAARVADDEVSVELSRREHPQLGRLRRELSELSRRETRSRPDAPVGEPAPEILLVEDDLELADHLMFLLEPTYRVTHAPDATLALELLARNAPDLILTDVMLPGISGAELIAAVRRDPAFDDVPIFVLSGHSEVELRLRLLRDGAQDFLGKPFDDAELLARIGNLVAARRAEVARREAESRFRAAFERTPVGMALVTPDGRWLRVNRSLCQITGYAESELRLRRVSDITHPDDVEAQRAEMGLLIAGESAGYTMETRYVHRDGRTVWVTLSGSLVRDEANEPLYFVSQTQDISERKRLEREITHLTNRSEESDPATSVLHRRGFEEALRAQVQRSRRYSEVAVLCRLRIDSGRGIFAGADPEGRRERLLGTVTHALRRRMRESDLIARWSPTELAILAVHVDEDRLYAVRDAVGAAAGEAVALSPYASLRPRLRIGCALVDGRVSPEEVLTAGRPTQAVRRGALALVQDRGTSR
jgi:PAS domain S-box-containing protein